MRKITPLNFDWYFCPDFKGEYLKSDFDGQNFAKVMLPHTMKELPLNNFHESVYQFVGSYYRDISPEAIEQEHMAVLRFFGVMVSAEVYLNGAMIMLHEGGYTPFEIDITDKLSYGKPNRLFVKVDGNEKKDVPPFGNVVDYLSYSGIYREVELEIRPKQHIEQLHIKTDEAPSLLETEMDLIVSVRMNKEFPTDAEAKFKILDNGKTIIEESVFDSFSSVLQVNIFVQQIERWDLDNPKLYTLEVSVFHDEQLIDNSSTRFGFRTAKFMNYGFVLNNRKTKLIGLNRHQSYPYVGYAMPKRQQERDAEILKYDLGCNIVRTSHYMQSDHFLNRCDEIGLLVFEEIPGWQYIGNDAFKELSYENVRTMVTHHINHPSIILWGVRINESPDDHDFYLKTNEIARSIDDSRQTAGVRNFKHSEFLEDVYAYNDFSHQGENACLENPNRVAGLLTPYLVTEHNGHMFPTRKEDDEQKRLDHALRHLNVIDAAYASDRICGAIGWCLSDYNTHKEFGANDRVCYHGVTDMFRIPKYASYPYMALKTDEPVLKIASSMTPGNMEKSMLKQTYVFTNCDYVKFYRNDDLLGKYYSDWHAFGSVPHAPIVIDDYIGNGIENDGEYSKTVAKRIKKVLYSFSKHGFAMPFVDKLRMLNLMSFHKISIGKAEEIYGRYVGNWGSSDVVYRFEGYIDDLLVKTATISQPKQAFFKVHPDDLVLDHSLTYDVTRVLMQMEDEYGNILEKAADAITVEADEYLQVIGPICVSLSGGSAGVYLRTTGKKGRGTVRFSCHNHAEVTINFEVK